MVKYSLLFFLSFISVANASWYVDIKGDSRLFHQEGLVGVQGGAAVGYRFHCFRLDASFSGYHISDKVWGKNHNTDYQLFINGCYDFSNCTCFLPYIGVGVGVVGESAANEKEWYFSSSYHKACFALQPKVGVTYLLSRRAELGLEYAYLIQNKTCDGGFLSLFIRFNL